MRPSILIKLSFVFLLLVSAFVASWLMNLVLFLALVIAGAVLTYSQTSLITHRTLFRRFLLYTVVFISFVTVLNGLFLREGDIMESILGLPLYREGLEFGLRTAFRLAVISITLLLFFVVTPIRALIHFLQHSGLPAPLVVILFLTLHFIAELPRRVNQIFTAQEARGAPVRGSMWGRAKAFFLILFPLLLSSISETIERGAALEARGFRGTLSGGQELTHSPLSIFLAVTFILLALLLIILNLFR